MNEYAVAEMKREGSKTLRDVKVALGGWTLRVRVFLKVLRGAFVVNEKNLESIVNFFYFGRRF